MCGLPEDVGRIFRLPWRQVQVAGAQAPLVPSPCNARTNRTIASDSSRVQLVVGQMSTIKWPGMSKVEVTFALPSRHPHTRSIPGKGYDEGHPEAAPPWNSHPTRCLLLFMFSIRGGAVRSY